MKDLKINWPWLGLALGWANRAHVHPYLLKIIFWCALEHGNLKYKQMKTTFSDASEQKAKEKFKMVKPLRAGCGPDVVGPIFVGGP